LYYAALSAYLLKLGLEQRPAAATMAAGQPPPTGIVPILEGRDRGRPATG
jgi:hypothetical protein